MSKTYTKEEIKTELKKLKAGNTESEEYDLGWDSALDCVGEHFDDKEEEDKTPKQGICEWCKDEYDEPPVVPLYKIRNRIACRDCAREWFMELNESFERYGDND